MDRAHFLVEVWERDGFHARGAWCSELRGLECVGCLGSCAFLWDRSGSSASASVSGEEASFEPTSLLVAVSAGVVEFSDNADSCGMVDAELPYPARVSNNADAKSVDAYVFVPCVS